VGGSALIVRSDLLRVLGGPLDIGSFLFGISIATALGFFVFQFRVWGRRTHAFIEIRQPSLNEGPSAAKLFVDAVTSVLAIVGIVICIIVVTLEYYGKHDVVVQALEFLAKKMWKLINALASP
jgi:hypothetical protein